MNIFFKNRALLFVCCLIANLAFGSDLEKVLASLDKLLDEKASAIRTLEEQLLDAKASRPSLKEGSLGVLHVFLGDLLLDESTRFLAEFKADHTQLQTKITELRSKIGQETKQLKTCAECGDKGNFKMCGNCCSVICQRANRQEHIKFCNINLRPKQENTRATGGGSAGAGPGPLVE